MAATAPLRARESTPLNLTATLGKSVLVAGNTPLAARGGYYCDVCLCLLKDSQTYLDHINGRKHQKKLGVTMKVDNKVGVDDVRERMRQWADKKAGEDRESKGREAARKRKRDGEDEGGDESKDDGEQADGREGGQSADEQKELSVPRSSVKEESVKEEGNDKTIKAKNEQERPAELDRTVEDEEESMMAAMGFKFGGFGGSKKT